MPYYYALQGTISSKIFCKVIDIQLWYCIGE